MVSDFYHPLLPALLVTLFLVTTAHVMLHKSDPRSAALWIVICLLLPVGGVLLYLLFGVNRLNRRVQKRAAVADVNQLRSPLVTTSTLPVSIDQPIPSVLAHWQPLVRTSGQVTGLALQPGNRLTPLFNGDQAFPSMLAAINQADRWLYLSSYIFDSRGIGQQFVDALVQAHQRGVQVRILVDGIGEWYDGGRAVRALKKAGVAVGVFMPLRLLPPQLGMNLRNHRKLLLVDGAVSFVGGMNIRQQNIATATNPRQIQDLMVKIEGPLQAQLAQIAADDWRYVTGASWSPQVMAGFGVPNDLGDLGDLGELDELDEPNKSNEFDLATGSNSGFCRAIADDPGPALGNLLAVLLGAVTSAQHSISIMTPYFLPPRELTALLQVATRRGVVVNVILPQSSDHPLVHWASQHLWRSLLEAGISLYLQPPPFAHTKLLIVDEGYVQFGSANIDSRSLRLNFELMVESYDQRFSATMAEFFNQTLAASEPVEISRLVQWALWRRLRNAFCWLFSPHL